MSRSKTVTLSYEEVSVIMNVANMKLKRNEDKIIKLGILIDMEDDLKDIKVYENSIDILEDQSNYLKSMLDKLI